jgi:hypothetical protein
VIRAWAAQVVDLFGGWHTVDGFRDASHQSRHGAIDDSQRTSCITHRYSSTTPTMTMERDISSLPDVSAFRESFGDGKPPEISRKITACVACRRQKVR